MENNSNKEVNEIKKNTVKDISLKSVKKVAPLWELRNLVAVNPFWGYSSKSFLNCNNDISSITGNSILPKKEVLKKLYENGEIKKTEIGKAIEKYKSLNFKESVDKKDIVEIIYSNDLSETKECYLSLAKALDKIEKSVTTWQSDIIIDISRFMQISYDKKISKIKTKNNKTLFENFIDYATHSKGMKARGIKNFNKKAKELTNNPYSIISNILKELNLNSDREIENYFDVLLFEIQGWAGYLRKQGFLEDKYETIEELLAIRMFYDKTLLDNLKTDLKSKVLTLFKSSLKFKSQIISKDLFARIVLLEAYENTIKEDFKNKILNTKKIDDPKRAEAQVIFCIDVRSEIMRRHIGINFPEIETYGFAGFFGIPLEILNEIEEAIPFCPVLLSPNIKASENKIRTKVEALKYKNTSLIKLFSKSGASCFSYVETIGFLSFFKLFKDIITPGFKKKKEENINYKLSLLDVDIKLSLAKGILTNMGLNKPYAKHVVLCGHGSDSANNPQNAGLACGACAGHAGIANAKIVCELLNCEDTRSELNKEGFDIPIDTEFVPALHNTMTDKISLYPKNTATIAKLKIKFDKGSEKVRAERSNRLDLNNKNLLKKLTLRSNDISETRPEWALANNCAFIVAKTNTIRDLDFKGRSFLHNYNPKLDENSAILEGILTAPMVVASWINLQYYASSVNPNIYGSGNKTIHNVCGSIGVLTGNDGDLRVGLAEQSVFNGETLEHKPSRLHVFIQSDTKTIDQILFKHSLVNDLVKNNWVKLFSLGKEIDNCHECLEGGSWVKA